MRKSGVIVALLCIAVLNGCGEKKAEPVETETVQEAVSISENEETEPEEETEAAIEVYPGYFNCDIDKDKVEAAFGDKKDIIKKLECTDKQPEKPEDAVDIKYSAEWYDLDGNVMEEDKNPPADPPLYAWLDGDTLKIWAPVEHYFLINLNAFEDYDGLEEIDAYMMFGSILQGGGNNVKVLTVRSGLPADVSVNNSVTRLSLGDNDALPNVEVLNLDADVNVSEFHDRYSLREINIGDGYTMHVGSNAFRDCENLTFSDFSKIRLLGSCDFAFSGCGISDKITLDLSYLSDMLSRSDYATEFAYSGLLALGRELEITGIDLTQYGFEFNGDEIIYTHPNSGARMLVAVLGGDKDSYRIPDGIHEVGTMALKNNHYGELTIPASVETMTSTALKNTDRVNVEDGNRFFVKSGSLLLGDEPHFLSEIVHCDRDATGNIEAYSSVSIGYYTIGSYAFYNCPDIENVKLGDAYVNPRNGFGSENPDAEIGTELQFPYGTDEHAVNNVESLTYYAGLVAPHAFEGCDNLKSISIDALGGNGNYGPYYIRENAFNNCKNLESIQILHKSFAKDRVGVNILNGAVNNCENLSRVMINAFLTRESGPEGIYAPIINCPNVKEIGFAMFDFDGKEALKVDCKLEKLEKVYCQFITGQDNLDAGQVESKITQNSVAMKEILDGFGINTDKIYVYYSRTGEELEIDL